MSIFDMLEGAAGSAAMSQIAERVGLPPSQLQAVVGTLAPLVISKLHSKSQEGSLDTSAGSQSPQPGTDAAEDHGNSILGSIFGSKEVSRSVAQETADNTGVSVDKVKQVLPQVASIAAAAMHQGKLGQGGGLADILSGTGL